MFYIFGYGGGNIGYSVFIRDYSLLDIGIYITPTKTLDIKPGTYSLIGLFIVVNLVY